MAMRTVQTAECEICGEPGRVIEGRRDRETGYMDSVCLCEEHEEDWREEYDRN